ncbi:Fic family protein [Stenotrophomonas geniculata]|uniref:Fic family protein n=1 Tax=Stenotrophomonas geniculata TaxID=86188 RepID=UPI000C1C0BDD|nr:Fic family protein [Stenotrophomonas geniculata]
MAIHLVPPVSFSTFVAGMANHARDIVAVEEKRSALLQLGSCLNTHDLCHGLLQFWGAHESELVHPLSEHVTRRQVLKRPHSSSVEHAALCEVAAQCRALLGNPAPAALQSVIKLIADRLGLDGGLRDGPNVTSADEAGNRWGYMPHTLLAKRLDWLVACAFDKGWPPFVRATWFYVGLLNCHPLRDGNGRVARVLFNALLWQREDVYLPIHEASDSLGSSLEICLRRAANGNDWSDIIRFLHNLLSAQLNALMLRMQFPRAQ